MDSNIDTRRDLAIKRLKAKNELRIHLVTYVTFNLMFVLVWFVAAVMLGGTFTFFWPILPMAGWAAGLIIHAYTVFHADWYTEEQLQREMKAISRV